MATYLKKIGQIENTILFRNHKKKFPLTVQLAILAIVTIIDRSYNFHRVESYISSLRVN